MYSIRLYVRITAGVSQNLVSCETPIQWGLVFITNICSIWYLIQFVHCAYIICNIHACDSNNLRTPQLVGFACQLGCKNHVHIIYNNINPLPTTPNLLQNFHDH